MRVIEQVRALTLVDGIEASCCTILPKGEM